MSAHLMLLLLSILIHHRWLFQGLWLLNWRVHNLQLLRKRHGCGAAGSWGVNTRSIVSCRSQSHAWGWGSRHG